MSRSQTATFGIGLFGSAFQSSVSFLKVVAILCPTSKMSHTRSRRDACVGGMWVGERINESTRHDGCACWLWRLVGPFHGLAGAGGACFVAVGCGGEATGTDLETGAAGFSASHAKYAATIAASA